MYKIVLWNHNDEKPIDIKIGGYATEKDAWEDFQDMVSVAFGSVIKAALKAMTKDRESRTAPEKD